LSAPDSRQIVRDTVRGVVIGGALFGGLAALQALRAGVSLGSVIQPILVFALIGLTVGGLAGPLLGRAARRRRGD
jgi:uncharacterized membrane protein YedE/YeeE